MPLDDRFCDVCGARRTPPVSSGAQRHVAATAPSLVWDYPIPLLTSRFMLWDFAKVVVLSALGSEFVIGAATYLIDGDLWVIPVPIIGMIAAGFGILLALVALLVYRNAFHATFTITPEGVGFASGTRERRINRLAMIGGILSGRPSAAGAGVLAHTQENVQYGWEDIHHVKVYPDVQVISLRNRWRTVVRLHCAPEVFDEAVALSQTYAARATAQRGREGAAVMAPTRRSYPVLVIWIGVTLLATFATQAMFYIDSETLRLALAGGLLVILAGVLTGIPMLVAVLLAFIVNVWLLLATADAVSPYTEPSEFVSSVGGALLLLGMTIARPFFHPLHPRESVSP